MPSGSEGFLMAPGFGGVAAAPLPPPPPILLLELVAALGPGRGLADGATGVVEPLLRAASLRAISSIILPPPPPPPPPMGPFEEGAGEEGSAPPPDLEPDAPFRAARFLRASAMLSPAPAPPPPPPRLPPPSDLFDVANESLNFVKSYRSLIKLDKTR